MQVAAAGNAMHGLQHEDLSGESDVEPSLSWPRASFWNGGGDIGGTANRLVEKAPLAGYSVELEIKQDDTGRAVIQLRFGHAELRVARRPRPSAALRRVDGGRTNPVLGAERGVEVGPLARAAGYGAAPFGEEEARQSRERESRAYSGAKQLSTIHFVHVLKLRSVGAAGKTWGRCSNGPGRGQDSTGGGDFLPRSTAE